MTSAIERLAKERGPDGRPFINPPGQNSKVGKGAFGGKGARGGAFCGTASGYTAGCRCDECKAAVAEQKRIQRARHRERSI